MLPTPGTGGAGSLPSAMSNLGLTQSVTPDELVQRRKKLMAAGAGSDQMAKFGDSAFSMLGLNPSSAQ